MLFNSYRQPLAQNSIFMFLWQIATKQTGLPVNHCYLLINLQLTLSPSQKKYHLLKSWNCQKIQHEDTCMQIKSSSTELILKNIIKKENYKAHI